jgi:hypothetical protein
MKTTEKCIIERFWRYIDYGYFYECTSRERIYIRGCY